MGWPGFKQKKKQPLKLVCYIIRNRREMSLAPLKPKLAQITSSSRHSLIVKDNNPNQAVSTTN